MCSFNLMSSEHFHVILHPNNQHGLILNRLDGTIATINHDDAKELSNLKKVGRIYGIIGKYLSNYLVLIKNRTLVGSLYDPRTKSEHDIYVITQVQVIDISCASNNKGGSVRYDASTENKDGQVINETIEIDEPSDPGDFSSLPITIRTNSYNNSRAAQWNPFRLANSLRPKVSTQLLRSAVGAESLSTSDNNSSGASQSSNQVEDSDKRLVDEMTKLFNNTNSFYYSPTLDLTQRFSEKKLLHEEGALWKGADERFFWNRNMLKDLIELSKSNDDANFFICVIMQGFVTIKKHTISFNTFNESGIETGLLATSTNLTSSMNSSANIDNCDSTTNLEKQQYRPVSRHYLLALISRRSVFHAGTRYRRRGCDEEGNCANFVETEQIFRHNQHFTSVVILRGSIPLFWYQTGFNYRPPPVMYRSHDENHEAFVKHFKKLIEDYQTDMIITIDCTEQSGREKGLHDAFRSHMEKLRLSIPNTKHIEFDFHKHCRGRQCSDIQVEKNLRYCGLTDQIIKDVKYYWNDGDVVLNQNGVFRVNCLDCSDRTNVVQRAIALSILDLQLSRLGVIAPDTCPEDNEFKRIMQTMWSANGNVLSTQYCGTRALFTGDKKLAGYLKDTYSSASRYYYSKFRDAYRQAAIDAMLGVETPIIDYASSANRKDLDQYELISLDPVLVGRSGGALLKDVGSKVSDRIARLRGKFYMRPFRLDNMENVSQGVQDYHLDHNNPELIDDPIDEALGGLNIDWPSTESVEQIGINSGFAQMSNDDSFQDDDINQLMLSIDVAELQRMRENEYGSNNDGSANDKEANEDCEEIHMTEACGLKPPSSQENTGATASATTSTQI